MSINPDQSSTPNHHGEAVNRILREILDRRHTRIIYSGTSGELVRTLQSHHQRNRLLRPSNDDPSLHLRMPPDPIRDREHQDTPEGFVLTALSPMYSGTSHDADAVLESNSRNSPTYRQLADPSTGGSSSDRRTRALMGPGERFMGRRRSGNSTSSTQRTERQLEVASSNLRALLDDPVPSLPFPSMLDHDAPSEDESNRRVKRRKLDNDKLEGGFNGFSYGRYGQVEPGKLTMEIVSCDGGIYLDDYCGQYSAENVLRNDDTVYCTKGNRCNLILKHQGSTPFCLKELIIKAPPRGFTAPVQEGMVFVSMTSDDLLTRTALYQIQYAAQRPPSRRSRDRSRVATPIMSIRHTRRDIHLSSVQARVRRLYEMGQESLEDEDDQEWRTAQLPSDFDVPKAPPFNVTIEYSDDEDDNDDDHDYEPDRNTQRHPGIPPRHRPALNRRGLRTFEPSDDEDSDETPLFADDREPSERIGDTRSFGREQASHITLAEAMEASQVATQEAIKAVGGELMAPHARFFIEQDKSKCTIKFDPPVSGRFILLKMWSPHATPSANIDIQSIVAKGFAGPRFFPAMDLR